MIPINFRKDLVRSHLPHVTEYLDRPEGVQFVSPQIRTNHRMR